MPQTVPQLHNACDIQAWMEDIGGNMVNVSGTSNSADLDFNQEIGEFKPFGSRWKLRLECGKDASGSLRVVYSDGVDEASKLVKDWYFNGGGSRKFLFYVPDNSPGSEVFEFKAVLDSMPITLDGTDANPISIDVSFMPDGEVFYDIVE